MLSNLFNFDAISLISTILILFISIIVGAYSKTYLRSDKKRYIFLTSIFLITISLIITFSSDNIFLMSVSWLISNLLLVKIMIHKASWKQAKNSGFLALKNFMIGFISLASALTILYFQTDSYKISEIIKNDNISQIALFSSCSLLLITALTQSAIYPFHNWLLSSLNSPTPASALMHAGLVNGGGIILARFAPLFFQMPDIMTFAFILGITSAIIGTLWKLIQSNIKGMLACSTMSQMGFMIAQCSMGLFPAAIAHLFWHGMFKSYLFLSSPTSWQEKRFDLGLNNSERNSNEISLYPPNKFSFLLSLICGISGALIFANINQIKIAELQTTLVLVAVSFIAASQIALTIIARSPIKKFFPALIISSTLSMVYAQSVVLIEKIMPSQIFNPQALNFWHVLAIITLFAIWLVRLFWISSDSTKKAILLKLYVTALNSSQPQLETITANRNHYVAN
jgi:NAD(P)H-quinone oxidoreductase subunit 5